MRKTPTAALLALVIVFANIGCTKREPTIASSRAQLGAEVNELRERLFIVEKKLNELQPQDIAPEPESTNTESGAEINNSTFLSVIESGSLCANITCSQMTVRNDGSFSLTDRSSKTKEGYIQPAHFSRLTRAIETSNLKRIAISAFQGECPETEENYEYFFSIKSAGNQYNFTNCQNDLTQKPEPIATIVSTLEYYGYRIEL